MAILDFLKRFFAGGGSASRPPPQRRSGARLNARGGMRVLVVDDSTTVVSLLGRMLRQNGYVVLEAFDAEKGIEVAMSERPDLVFLDIVLPGMSGFAALRQLRRQPATRDIPIIMMSGNEQATEQFYAQRIGADDFMKKPFSRAEVFMRIENLLDVSLLPRRHTSTPAPVASTEPSAVP
jgi:twitching motility two-component system response regulator PilH